MNLRVNHSEINDFCDLTNIQSELFREQIQVWKENLEELKTIWQGEDADKFFENATSYVERLRVIPECYESLSGFVQNANNEYHEKDKENRKQFEKDIVYEEGEIRG